LTRPQRKAAGDGGHLTSQIIQQIKSDIASAAGKTRLGGVDKFGPSEAAPMSAV